MISFNFFCLCDAPESWQLGLQDPATPIMEAMIHFHNILLFVILFIGAFVFFVLSIVLVRYTEKNNPTPTIFTHSSVLEIVWTLVPVLILALTAIPSFSVLYSLDEMIHPSITLKIVGHQWYWSYEYSDNLPTGQIATISYDSYMVDTDTLVSGHFRLLEVDTMVILPINTYIRLLVTAADVIHSWTVPAFGIKMDACPGRLSQVSLFIKREGIFYGQCSEICGVNHGFMPIKVQAVSSESYVDCFNDIISLSN